MSAIDSDRPPYPEVAPCATVLGDVSAHRSMELHRRPAGRSPHSESHIRCTSNAKFPPITRSSEQGQSIGGDCGLSTTHEKTRRTLRHCAG
jgi:hypothetical protein